MSQSAARKSTVEAESSFVISPLQPTIGAEISGIDISRPISDDVRDAIKAAVLKYKVVFFRDQTLDNAQHAAFANRFGPLYTHPSTKHDAKITPLHQISAEEAKTYLDTVTPKQLRNAYHTDTSWRLVPTWGAVLRAVDLPELGGDTIWVDAGLAYRALPDDIKARLEGKFVTHDFNSALVRAGHEYPIVAHPIVRAHRETGQKILWVNFTQRPHIVGVDIADGKALLTTILAQYKKPEYQVRFSWRPGSVAFWDNRGAVHYAIRNYGDFPRLMHRVLIADEPLYAEL